ncbi:MAG: hypothetical protein H6739_20100 [Alphaproteobacteria bacterium]|nr:hypothetical protein [Alphaproteobacteria bacterium]
MRALLPLLLIACTKGDLGYETCEVAEDCGEVVPEDATAVCIDKSGEGFCTWTCEADADCENLDYDEDFARVCASFESEDDTYCFPACDEEAEDEEDVCPPDFNCRSTGGGSENRRVCFPNE